MSMSLTKILNDPSLLFDGDRLKKQTEKVKKDKRNIVSSAEAYNNRYHQEIEEGTRKRQLMIENGEKRGLKEEDVMKGSFVPAKHTPILNWLYFMMKEDNVNFGWEETRKKYNQQYGALQDDYDYAESNNFDDPKPMEEFIYGNLSIDMFNKIKKLKTLALSSKCNEHESALAFSMCKDLCIKHGLDFDKVPVNNKSKG